MSVLLRQSKLFTNCAVQLYSRSVINGQVIQKRLGKNLVAEIQARSFKGGEVPPKSFFLRHLLLANTVSSGLLMLLGDWAQQEIEFHHGSLAERYEWDRLARMTTVGFVLGPVHHYYYLYIDKIWPGNTMKIVGKKILADQFIGSPLCIVLFFIGMGLMERKGLKESWNETTSKFITVYLVDWLFWPPAQFINFYYLSTQHRVLYVNIITAVYNVFLSYMKHYDRGEKKNQ